MFRVSLVLFSREECLSRGRYSDRKAKDKRSVIERQRRESREF